jgi:signal transduction histidine kinase
LAGFAATCFLPPLQVWKMRTEIGNELALERSFKAIIEAVYNTDYADVDESDYPKNDPILKEIIQQAVRVFGGHSGSILLKVPGEDKLRVEKDVHYGSRTDTGIIVHFSEGLCGYSATHRETVAAPDVSRDERYVETLPGIRSEICTPIIIENEVIGVINIDSKNLGQFRQDDLRTISALETFAKQAAVALSQARLFSEREEFRKQVARTTQLLTASSVASGLAHELKNGLLAIATLAQKLTPDPSLRMSDDNRRRLEDIRKESNKLSNLALRLMDLSRVGEPHKTRTYLNNIIANRISVLEDFVRIKGMKLVTKYDPDLNEPTQGKGHPILVDDNQIEQVLTNLILNAVDASQKKGQPIEVETKNRTPQSVSFLVRDYGLGITPENKTRMFDMFFTTKPEGFGIGLPVVKILVEENHHGTIEIDTKPGRGTTFEIILPKLTI